MIEIGLFGSLGTDDFAANVSNVTLIDCTFAATAASGVVPAGAIAGEIERGTVSGCTVKGNSSVSALTDGSQTGAIVGFAGVNSTLTKNYYTFDVTVSNSAATREDYALRGTWKEDDEDPALSTWIDLNDANEGAMLLVRKATVPAENANGSKVTFNETTKGVNRYDHGDDDFYYVAGQSVTLTVSTGTKTVDGCTFSDELETLTMNGTDIKDALGFTMPAEDATIAATFTPSDWFTIKSNKKAWMSFYHEWKDATGAPANYIVSDGSGMGKTVKAKTVESFNLITGAVTPVDLSNVSYSGVPTLFHCEPLKDPSTNTLTSLPALLKFTPVADVTAPNYDNRIKGVTEDTYLTGSLIFVMNGLGDFISAYDKSEPLKAHRCYIDLSATPTNATRLYIAVDGEETGIETPPLTPPLEGAGSWYDLQGRKLSGKPKQKGVYIHDGKQKIIK